MIEIVTRAEDHVENVAVVDESGEHRYRQLLDASAQVARVLLQGTDDLLEGRVAFMVPSTFEYVRVQWGIWRAGGVAVPLCLSHPAPELAYVLDDARPTVVIASPEYRTTLQPLVRERGLRWLDTSDLEGGRHVSLPDVAVDRRAMMVYTSGTTGHPKGVVTTHRNLTAQITSLVEAWGWTDADRTLLTLPLHHVHGIVNVVSCALWAGAVCEMHRGFDARAVWDRIASGDLTNYMAVPTVYHRLIETWEASDEEERERLSDGARTLRLMVSGSAALPVPTFEKWETLSGHRLLERYGMTEIGMALSNPLDGVRQPGHVGSPLPGVGVRLVDEDGQPVADGTPGEIQIRGDAVFLEYWDRPDATEEAFTDDGWFRTGDIAVCHDGVFQIMGRNSVDILKTGGEKVSALEIEGALLAHPGITECAVVGIEDPAWGQRVVAVVVARQQPAPGAEELRAWCAERLAPYKVPKQVIEVDALPRNAMGKVLKPTVMEMVTPS